MQINELVTALNFKLDVAGINKFDRSMGKMQQEANRATSGMKGMFQRAGSAINDALKFKVKVGGVSEAKKQLGGVEKAFGQIKAMAAGYVGFNALKDLGAGILQAGTDYERLQAALSTAVGSDKGAKAAYAQIEDFARKTPYDLKQVAEAFIKLKNLGLDPSQAALTSYGNTAGAMGKPLNQMIEAVADASTFEFERLKEFGIKAKQQGDQVSFTFRGVTTSVHKDANSIQAYLLKMGNTTFAGGMAKQGATIGGIMSTMSDNFAALGRAVWKGGVGEEAKKFVKWLSDSTEKILPLVDKYLPKFIQQAIKLGKQALILLPPILEGVASGLTAVLALMAYSKISAGIQAFQAFIMILRSMTAAELAQAAAAALANAATLLIPIAIGAAIAAVVWFGIQVYKYMHGGKKAIEGLRKQFPMMADAVVWVSQALIGMMPFLKAAGVFIWRFLVLTFKAVWAVVTWLWKNIFAPMFSDFFRDIQIMGGWIATAYDFWMPKLVAGFYTWKSVLEDVWAFLEPKFKWLLDTLKGVSGLAGSAFSGVAGLFGGGGSAAGGGADPSSIGGAYNASFGGRIAQEAKATATRMNSFNKCAYGVETSLSKLGINFTGHAYQLKAQLDKDKRFVKVNATDEQMKHLPPGAIVVHNNNPAYKGPGLGGQYGHVSVALGNGMEASDHISKQMIHHYAGGGRSVYYPVGSQGTIPGVQTSKAGGMGSVTVPQTIQVFGNASPTQVKQAAHDGTAQALTKAGMGRPVAASPTR